MRKLFIWNLLCAVWTVEYIGDIEGDVAPLKTHGAKRVRIGVAE